MSSVLPGTEMQRNPVMRDSERALISLETMWQAHGDYWHLVSKSGFKGE